MGQKSLEFTSSLAVLCQMKKGDFDGEKSNAGLNKAQTAPRAGGSDGGRRDSQSFDIGTHL